MRTHPTIAASLLVAALCLAGCSDDGSSSSPSSPTSSDEASSPTTSADAETSTTPAPTPSEDAGTVVDITVENGSVSPKGDRVTAELGEPITLRIDSDTAGELHIHSTPEQEIPYEAGTSTKKLTIDQPGIVDVEDHELEQIVVQLQVS